MCAPKLKRKIVQKGDVQSFTEGCVANDMVAGTRLVSRTVVAATREDAAFLGWNPAASSSLSSACVRQTACPSCSRTTPLCWPTIPICRRLPTRTSRTTPSLRSLPSIPGRAPLKSDPCTVEIALADAQAAPLLEVPVGEPLFYMEAYFTDEDERPLLLGRQRSWARAMCSTSNVHR